MTFLTEQVVRELSPSKMETIFPHACFCQSLAPLIAEAKLRGLKLLVTYTKNSGGARGGVRDLKVEILEESHDE